MSSDSSKFGDNKTKKAIVKGPLPPQKGFHKIPNKLLGPSQLAAPPFRPRFQSDEGGPYSAQKKPSEIESSSLEYFNDYTYTGKTNSAHKPNNNQFSYNSGAQARGRNRGRGGRRLNMHPHQLNFNNEGQHESPQYPVHSTNSTSTVNEKKFKEGCDFVGSEHTNKFLSFNLQMYSTEMVNNPLSYGLQGYIKDLIGLFLCIHQDLDQHTYVLHQLAITQDQCKKTYMPMLIEVRENFKSSQSDFIGGPDKILVMILNKLIAVLKNFPKEISPYLPALVNSFICIMEKSLKHKDGINEEFIKADSIDLLCLKTIFETCKANEVPKDLTQNSFKILYKLLYIGTPEEYKIVKYKNKGGCGIDTDEEEKNYTKGNIDPLKFRNSLWSTELSNYDNAPLRSRASSDPSSAECGNCGNKYKTAVLSRIRSQTLCCIASLCQLNSKHLVGFYKLILSFAKMKEKNKSIKESICSILSHFLNNSGIEKCTLDALSSNSKGKELPNLSPKSLVKLPKTINFNESKSEINTLLEEADFSKGLDFFEKMHYSLSEMLEQESNIKTQANIMKTLYYLVLKTPYSRLQFGVVSENVLSFVTDHLRYKGVGDSSEAYTDQTKTIKLELQISQLVKVLLSVKELKAELRDNFCWEQFPHFLAPTEMNVEILAMVGRNYPDILFANWDLLKGFCDSVLFTDNRKLHLLVLKMLEEWLNNFNKIVSTKEEEQYSQRHISKVDSFGLSSSSLSKKSDEEDKVSEDSQDSDRFSSRSSRAPQNTIKLDRFDPFTLDDFSSFLKSTFDWFLFNSSDVEAQCIVLNILSFMKEENWNELYKEEDIEAIFNLIDSSKQIGNMKTTSIKFLGYIIYHKLIYCNKQFVAYIIENLYCYQKDGNMQVCLKNSWSIANVCCTCDLNSLETHLVSKLLSLSMKYSNSSKEKVLSSSIRAIGYIISKCSKETLLKVFNSINCVGNTISNSSKHASHGTQSDSECKAGLENSENPSECKGIDLSSIVSMMISKIKSNSPKISWNTCVSIGHILDADHIRDTSFGDIFSKDCMNSLIEIVKDRPNYKTKIHATQTLNKFRSYEEYGDSFFDIFYMAASSLKELTSIRDDTEYKYVENLEEHLLDLQLHLMHCVIRNDESTLKMAKFLKEHIKLLKDAIINYCVELCKSDRKDRRCKHEIDIGPNSITSSQDSTHEEYEECIVESTSGEASGNHSEQPRTSLANVKSETALRSVLTKVKQFMTLLRDYIDNCDSVQIPFDIFQKLHEVADMPIEEYSTISK